MLVGGGVAGLEELGVLKDFQDPLLFLLIELTHREWGLVLLCLQGLQVDLELLIIHGHLNVISVD